MLAQMEEYLGPMQEQVGIPTTTILKRVNQWARYGKKLCLLCAEFGPGCLFYLADNTLFSEDLWGIIPCDCLGSNADLDGSLEHRFRTSGPYRNDAFDHLHHLGLKEKADNSGANDLGRNIRHYLINPFQSGEAMGNDDLRIDRRHVHEPRHGDEDDHPQDETDPVDMVG